MARLNSKCDQIFDGKRSLLCFLTFSCSRLLTFLSVFAYPLLHNPSTPQPHLSFFSMPLQEFIGTTFTAANCTDEPWQSFALWRTTSGRTTYRRPTTESYCLSLSLLEHHLLMIFSERTAGMGSAGRRIQVGPVISPSDSGLHPGFTVRRSTYICVMRHI
jgi:hypothetical protein